MASLGFSEKIQDNSKDLQSMEHMVGKGLMMPFNNTNAGANSCQYI